MLSKVDKSKIKAFIPLFLVLLFVILLILFICYKIESHKRYFLKNFNVSGVEITQKLHGKEAEITANLTNEKVEQVAQDFFGNDENSLINSLNKQNDTWVKVHPDCINIFDFINNFSDIAQEFNPFDLKFEINRDANRIKLISGNLLVLDGIKDAIFCTEAVKIYENSRINRGIISTESIVGVYGSKPNGSMWRISIKNPLENKDNSGALGVAAVKLSSGFVATFGCFDDKIKTENSFFNKKIFDNEQNFINNDIDSVSVLHENAIIAKILAYICCEMGIQASKPILSRFNAESIFLLKDKKIHVSQNIKDFFEIIDKSYSIFD